MKTFHTAPPPGARERGVALIIVLSVIVLTTALIVGFLLRAGTNRAATSSYSAKVSTRQLADMAVNLVQGQINDATNQGVNTTWASQPGAVRVFDDTGAMTKIYRLYSSGTAMTTTGTIELTDDLPPTTWATSPALWVDLNAPITVQGVMSGTSGVSGTSPLLSYPILDPRNPLSPGTGTSANVLQDPKLPGFFLGKNNSTGVVAGTTTVPGATALQPAPMPVRWMYVLKDGSIVPPSTGSTANTVTIVTASSSNPIVGRIAFWTDDETCKVNINTAAGSMSFRPDPSQSYSANAYLPAPWDTPRFAIWDEYRLFSQNQPVHSEYQRYPGHPATTDLYTILGGPDPINNGYSGLGMQFWNTNPLYPPDATVASPGFTASGSMPGPTAAGTSSFFALLPRYGDAWSSYGGTANTTLTNSLTTSVTISGNLPRRLYSSVGEFLYSTGTSSSTRLQNTVSIALTRQQVETGKFFLTAHSNAPEVTLFGTPRISMWPVDSNYGTATPGPVISNTTPLATAYDKLSAFCTTSGTGTGIAQYYFQRHDSTSGTNDYVNIPRNQKLYSYLQYLTSKPVPGFGGGNFNTKYSVSGERDQILTEMVDYIRSTDTYDWSVSGANPRFTPAYGAFFNGNGQVVPLVISGANVAGSGTTQGLGRACTLSEVGMLLVCTADGNSTLSGSYVPAVTGGGGKISTVAGSANDYRYVSNLPEAQYLLNSGSSQVGLNPATGYTGQAGTTASGSFARNNALTTAGGTTMFPANPTLANSYGGAMTPLQRGQKRVQAMLLFELSSPMEGFNQLWPDVQVKVTGLNSVSFGTATPFASSYGLLTPVGNRTGTLDELGGYQPWSIFICRPATAGGVNSRGNGWSTVINSGTACPSFSPSTNPANTNLYWFVSAPFTVPDDDTGTASLAFGGGPFKIELMATPKGGTVGTTTPVTAQTINVTFPNATIPVPDLMQYGVVQDNGTTFPSTRYDLTSAADWWGFDNRISWACGALSCSNNNLTNASNIALGSIIRADPINTTPASTAGNWTYMSGALIPTPYYKDPLGHAPAVQAPSDVVRTLIPKAGDMRLVMAKNVITADGVKDMFPTEGYTSSTIKLANTLSTVGGHSSVPGHDFGGRLVPNGSYAALYAPKVPSTYSSPPNNWDWDTGQVGSIDGAYANKPDEGTVYIGAGVSPYFNAGNQGAITPSNFTANRIIPSPVMFGSLPTGVTENIPWRTLQFRPIKTADGTTYNHDVRNDAADSTDTYTLNGPADHLLLDLFTMPVVEPYAISEPFSTSGKINMNYQILPFTYITRSSGVRAVLGSELIARVPLAATSYTSASTQVNSYKGGSGSSAAPTKPGGGVSVARLPLNLDESNGTLAQFSAKFASGGIFKSASEICDIYLIPQDNSTSYTWPGFDMRWYGSDFALVGDNVRERPYADIYPRLTTKSNTFTVHYKVQAIQTNPLTPTQWNEKTGVVKAAFQGSTTVERFVDPTDNNIPDYGDGTDPTNKTPIGNFYKWRIIANNAFPP